MRSNFVNRLRSNSIPLNTIPPTPTSSEYSPELAALAARILYRSPLPSPSDLPVFVLNSAAFPEAGQEYYDQLLPYVLTRLPTEDELIGGLEYEIVFFAGGNSGSNYGNRLEEDSNDESGGGVGLGKRKTRPRFGWFMKAYNVLNRITRKRMQKLWIVHEKRWVRVLFEMFATVVSPKFRKKVVHVSTLNAFALYFPIENLLIPPSAYVTDRRRLPDIDVPYASGKRAFGTRKALPISSSSGDSQPRLPRVLRETTSFILLDSNIQTEGLFRVSARQQTVEVLREAYDRGQKFIIWHEGSTVLTIAHHQEGHGDVSISQTEAEQVEGYDVHTAAALIKLWYKELREPIFPQSSYQALQKYFGDPQTPLEPSTLLQLLNPGVEYSILNESSRQILKLHLLPLLSLVTANAETNKMTPLNLSVCFAPILLCGPDPLEDVKILSIVRRLLVALIEQWSEFLAPALDTDTSRFLSLLQLPFSVSDREDPLEEPQSNPSSPLRDSINPAQTSGITLLDNSNSTSQPTANNRRHRHTLSNSSSSTLPSSESEDESSARPPLPPRPRAATLAISSSISATRSPLTFATTTAVADNPAPALRRKPAPPLHTPPRYSTLVSENAPRYSAIVSDPTAALARLSQPTSPDPSRRIPRSQTAGPTNTVEPDDDDDTDGGVGVIASKHAEATTRDGEDVHGGEELPLYDGFAARTSSLVAQAMGESISGSGVDLSAQTEPSSRSAAGVIVEDDSGRPRALTEDDRQNSIPRKPVGEGKS